jgi:hypothetical protein
VDRITHSVAAGKKSINAIISQDQESESGLCSNKIKTGPNGPEKLESGKKN